MDNVDHGLVHVFPVLLALYVIAPDNLARYVYPFELGNLFDGPDQVRAKAHALAGKGRRGIGQLQRRHQQRTLADAGDQGFSRKPWHAIVPAFPLAGWHQAAPLARTVHPGLLPETELAHKLRHAIDTQPIRQVVEINIAGLGNRPVQVERTMPLFLPVAVASLLVGQLVVADTVNLVIVLGDRRFQPEQPEKRLGSGSRRVLPRESTVEQWPTVGIAQVAVLLDPDTVDEQVRVEQRHGDQCQDFTVIGIDGDRCPGIVGKGFLGNLLQPRIDGQVQVIALHRR